MPSARCGSKRSPRFTPGSAAYKEAQQEVASFSTQIARQAAEAQRTIEQQNVETQIAIGHTRIDAEKSVLEEELAAHRLTAAQKLAALTTLAQQETDLDIKGLQARLAVAGLEPAERNRINNQILELRAKLNADLAALDRQAAADAKREAEEQARAWKDAVNEIEGAETGMISSVLSRRKTLGQALYQEASKVADQEIESFVRAETTRMLLGNTEEAQRRAQEQGGLLYHLFTQQAMTQADIDEALKRDAVAGEADLEQRTADTLATDWNAIQQQIQTGRTVQGQTAQTGAVVAGGQARVAATQTAAAEGAAIQSEIQSRSIMADAAKAFSGVYASVASIPYVGWILAPVAAAAAFAAVSAYEGMASFDAGAWEVPHDMAASIHQGEMVVPASHAEAMRNAVSASAGFGGLSASIASGTAVQQTAGGVSEAVASMAQVGDSASTAGQAAARALGGSGIVPVAPPVAGDLSGLRTPTAESRTIVQAAEQMGGGATAGDRVSAFSELVKTVAAHHHFETGAWEVPADQLAQIHQGEMVVPAAQASVLRSALGLGAADSGAKALIRAAVGGGGSAAVAAAAATPPAAPMPPPVGVAPWDREAAAGATTVPGSGGIDYAALGDADAGIPPAEEPVLGYKKVGVSQGGMVYQPGAPGFGEKTMFLPLGFLTRCSAPVFSLTSRTGLTGSSAALSPAPYRSYRRSQEL